MGNKLKDIWDSLKTGSEGLSGRKLAAFWSINVVATGATVAIIYMVHKRNESEVLIYLIYALLIWIIFGAVCLGLVTIPDLIKFLAELKNGKNDEKNNPE